MQLIRSIQERILRRFGRVPESGSFYLTGGTALARFYLKHRKSNDLDFFSAEEELIDPFSRRLEKTLRADGMEVERRRGFRSFVELLARAGSEQTVVHLALDAPFRFEPPKEFPEYPGLKVDGLQDIASNKLLALFGRAALRDFIDVYTLVEKGHFSADALMEKAKRKDPGFDLYWLGVAFEQIKSFSDDAPDVLMLAEPVPLEKLKAFFDGWRQRIAEDLSSSSS